MKKNQLLLYTTVLINLMKKILSERIQRSSVWFHLYKIQTPVHLVCGDRFHGSGGGCRDVFMS